MCCVNYRFKISLFLRGFQNSDACPFAKILGGGGVGYPCYRPDDPVPKVLVPPTKFHYFAPITQQNKHIRLRGVGRWSARPTIPAFY